MTLALAPTETSLSDDELLWFHWIDLLRKNDPVGYRIVLRHELEWFDLYMQNPEFWTFSVFRARISQEVESS